jgi:flagellin-like protein
MKILKNRKALSPVVASIILIAVTVAVSIAVAAWMGALSFSFMSGGEQMQLGTPYGWVNGNSTVYVRASCPAGNAFTITAARINGVDSTSALTSDNGLTVAPQNSTVLLITYGGGNVFTSGYSYTIVITTAKNNEFTTTGQCP